MVGCEDVEVRWGERVEQRRCDGVHRVKRDDGVQVKEQAVLSSRVDTACLRANRISFVDRVSSGRPGSPAVRHRRRHPEARPSRKRHGCTWHVEGRAHQPRQS